MHTKRPLLLVGMMGAGKSTLGKLLAQRHSLPFVDLDEAIEAKSGLSIEQLFEQPEGEAHFRSLEAQVFEQVLLQTKGPAVIALGGGTLLREGSLSLALAHGVLVWLKTRPETLAQRLFVMESGGRPLLAAMDSKEALIQKLQTLSQERETRYQKAHATLSTDERSPAELCDALSQLYLHSELQRVDLGPRSYAIQIGPNPALALSEQLRLLSPTSVFLISDTHVLSQWGHSLEKGLEPGPYRFQKILCVARGEQAKSWESAGKLLEALIEAGADRGSVLVALGGGSMSDLVGFAASLLFRGIRWIALPSTLLSMVDASVGGKTGVDLAHTKNAVGRVHQPRAVIVDPQMSRSESERSFRSGLAEALKTALVLDAELFCFLESEYPRVLSRDPETLRTLISRSLRAKAGVIERDEEEQGERVVLNFGHTVGHALEAFGEFQRFTHGEAVALGMVVEARVGEAFSCTPSALVHRLIHLLKALGLETEIGRDELEQALEHAQRDKKRRGDRLLTVFPSALGQSLRKEVPFGDFRAAALRSTAKRAK